MLTSRNMRSRLQHGSEPRCCEKGMLTPDQTRRREKPMWGLIVIQWLHVFSGIFWFGSTLYLDFVVIPAVMTLPLEQQRTVSKPLTRFSERVIIPAAILVILLGLERGTIFGPVSSLDFWFGTVYAIPFLIDFRAALASVALWQM